MPGPTEAGPVLQHTIEVVADGASWLHLGAHVVLENSGIVLNLPDKAPARTVADKTAALAAQHGSTFAKNTMGSHGVSQSNVTFPAFYFSQCVHAPKRYHVWG